MLNLMPKGMWKLDQKTQDWSTPSFPQEKMIRSCKTMKCVGSKDARLWQGWCRYKGAKCRMYGCVTKVSECPNQTRYAEKTEPRVSMTLRSIENSNHKQEVESQCQNPQGGYERQAGRWWQPWTPKPGMRLWTSCWEKTTLNVVNEKTRRLWKPSWEMMTALNTETGNETVMALNAKTENVTLSINLVSDDGSEHRTKMWWWLWTPIEMRWWWLWTPILRSDEDGFERRYWEVMALNVDTKKWWEWLWTPILSMRWGWLWTLMLKKWLWTPNRKMNNGSERQNETMALNAKRKTMALNAKLN